MDLEELRHRLTAILAEEDRDQPDWAMIERLADALRHELPIDGVPEIAYRYLDDADIRSRDPTYAKRQKQEVRRLIELGEYDDGKPIPAWGCVLVLLASAGILKWLLR